MKTKLNWTTETDDNDNSYWEAPSPYGDGEPGFITPFYFRIRQRYVANEIQFYEASDPEAMLDESEPQQWASLEAAQTQFEVWNREILKDEQP